MCTRVLHTHTRPQFNATIVAKAYSEIMRLLRSDFLELLNDFPQLRNISRIQPARPWGELYPEPYLGPARSLLAADPCPPTAS